MVMMWYQQLAHLPYICLSYPILSLSTSSSWGEKHSRQGKWRQGWIRGWYNSYTPEHIYAHFPAPYIIRYGPYIYLSPSPILTSYLFFLTKPPSQTKAQTNKAPDISSLQRERKKERHRNLFTSTTNHISYSRCITPLAPSAVAPSPATSRRAAPAVP